MSPNGEVRVLSVGKMSNAILCRNCFNHEMQWRKERNRDLGDFAKFDIVKWTDLKVYTSE